MKFPRPSQEEISVNLTPLIDVVFILLLFFMLSSNFMHWRQISLSSANQTENTPDEILVVRVESDAGRVTHDGKTYQLSDLDGLRTLVAEAPEAVYAVEAAPEVKTQTLVSLLDQLHRAGAQKVSMTGVLP